MPDDTAHPDTLNSNAQGQLRSIVERIERLELEKGEIAGQIKEVKAEAKGNGFDPKIIGMVVRLRKQQPAKRQEEAALLDLYLSALGELPDFEPAAEARDGGITSITITTGGASVTTTPAVMAEALEVLAVENRYYDQALACVREAGNASVSFIQRRLQIGYNRAASLIERMEREGVVGPVDQAGRRALFPVAQP